MEILKYPDEHLVALNVAFAKWMPEAAAKVEEMFRLTAAVGGVGLAAPQVGWNVRLFILAVPEKDGSLLRRVVFNPKVETGGARMWFDEGCLSFPGIYARIERWAEARLVGETPEGPIDETFGGMAAQAVQHEIDHLEGLLFIERMTPASRRRNDPYIKELERGR